MIKAALTILIIGILSKQIINMIHEIIHSVKEDAFFYIKYLVIGFLAYINAPSKFIPKLFLNTGLSEWEMERIGNIVDGIIALFFVVCTLLVSHYVKKKLRKK